MSIKKTYKVKVDVDEGSSIQTLKDIKAQAAKAAKAIDNVANRTAKRRAMHKKADPFGIHQNTRNPAASADPLGTRFLSNPSRRDAYNARMRAKYPRTPLLTKRFQSFGATTTQGMFGQNFSASGIMGKDAPDKNNLDSKDRYKRRLLAYKKFLKDKKKLQKQAWSAWASLEKKSTILTKEESEKRQRMIEDEADRRVRETKEAAAKQAAIEKNIKNQFAAGFSLHILQIYAMPLVYTMNRVMSETLRTFGEFDKKFTDYMVKSEEYASRLSKSQFYDITAGQTYSLIEATEAAERFAASGIDVAQSQEALIDTMRVATISGLDYKSAANGVIRTMQAMHLGIEDTAMITDAMVNSANASTAELQDLVGWFEYAAAGAYQAGVNVKELSAMLGILSSTGLPNTGTAARQLFLQFSKQSVRDKFMENFSWINDDSFSDIDSLIKQLREYVQTSEDQAKASREVTMLLGGKVTAQQALNNLLVAEESLWNQVNNAVAKTGTTQDLYNKITDNTGHALQRLANSWELFKAQFGEIFHPLVDVLEKIVTAGVKLMNATPKIIKQLGGGLMLVAAGATTAAFALAGMIGALAIMQGATSMLELHQLKLTLSTHAYRDALTALARQLSITTGTEKYYDMVTRKTALTNVAAANSATMAQRAYSAMTSVSFN